VIINNTTIIVVISDIHNRKVKINRKIPGIGGICDAYIYRGE
jgi:hypothetical protein